MADDFRQAQTLDIPNGTTFEFKDGKLVFGHESDIVIRTNMGGYKFQKIYSKKGSVQVVPPTGVEFDVDEIEAVNGDVFLNGKVRVRHARARTIHFQEGALTADHLEATAEALLSGRRLDVLHVKAPRVVIDGEAEGTCLIVQSDNDPGKVKVHGGFRTLDEAREAFSRFERATSGVGTSREPAAAAAPAPVVSAPAPAPRPAVPAAPTAPAVAPAAGPRAAPTGPIDGDATLLTGSLHAASTEEFRTPFATPSGEPDSGSALPKSSVFRKRK